MQPTLTIRGEQLALLSAELVDRLVTDLAQHLRSYFPALASCPAVTLDTHIRDCLAQAHKYGLFARQDLYRFLNLHAFLGWDCLSGDDAGWMREWLSSAGRGRPAARLLGLHQQVLFNIEARRAS